jgi:hypothetical protein
MLAFVGGVAIELYFPRRHCERSEATQSRFAELDCFAAIAPRNDGE